MRMFPPIVLAVALAALPRACLLKAATPADIIFAGEEFAREQTELTVSHILSERWGFTDKLFPFETKAELGNAWDYRNWAAWASGFLPGILWHFAEATGEPVWEARARQFTEALDGWKTRSGDHDIGFNLLSSFGRGHDLTGSDADRQVLVTGANTFSTAHWMPAVGSLWSFNFDNPLRNDPAGTERWRGPIRKQQNVIVDTSMNIELLFRGARLGGDLEWYERGLSHMRNVVRDLVRPDGGTIQVVDYWLTDTWVGDAFYPAGSLRGAYAWQGYSNASTWSRGQGWALHGLATAYRETGDPDILEGVLRVADYYLRETPADGVPYWDYDAAAIAGPLYLEYYAARNRDIYARDSSAAAIAAAGLLQLSVLLDDAAARRRYFDTAETILVSLSTPVPLGGYLAMGTNYESILARGTYTFDGYDKGLAWGDFYYLQAIQRYREIVAPPAVWSADPVAGRTERWGWAPAHVWAVRRHAGKPAMGVTHGRYGTGIGGRPRAVALLDAPIAGDFTFAVEVATAENLMVRGDASAMILFNWLDEAHYHYILLSAESGRSGLYSVAAGVESLVESVAAPQLLDYGWRTVVLERVGAAHTVTVDGDPVLVFNAAAPAGGRLIGVGTDGHSAFFASAQLSAALPPDGYGAWAEAAIPDPLQRDPELDADGNGLANVLEYLLGTGAGEAPQSLAVASAPGAEPALEVRYAGVVRPDYRLVLEQSPDLEEWSAVATPLPMHLLPDNAGRREARLPVPPGGRFYRLRAVASPSDISPRPGRESASRPAR